MRTSEVVMMPNGFVGCWLVTGPDEGNGRTVRTGMSEQETERVGREWATRLRVPFRKVRSWREAEEPC
jgi:hypothetical protein